MSEGKSFHIDASATGTVRRQSQTVESLTSGTNRILVVEDRSLLLSFLHLSFAGNKDSG